MKLTAYNGSSIPVLGKCILKTTNKAIISHVLFIVADTDSPPILGLTTSEKLGLIKRIMEINVEYVLDDLLQFRDCFGDIGTLPQTHHIELKPGVTPVIHPPRRIPYALKPQLREELSRIKKLGIVGKVTEPTDWVNGLVIVHKANGKLRICIDPRDLNKAIKRQHFQLP